MRLLVCYCRTSYIYILYFQLIFGSFVKADNALLQPKNDFFSSDEIIVQSGTAHIEKIHFKKSESETGVGSFSREWQITAPQQNYLKISLQFRKLVSQTSRKSCDQFTINLEEKMRILSKNICVPDTEYEYIQKIKDSVSHFKLSGPKRNLSIVLESFAENVVKKLNEVSRSNVRNFPLTSACGDAILEPGVCSRHKAMNQCNWPSVRNQCKRTCNVCEYGSWTKWEVWSECTVTCGLGVQVRERFCTHAPCPPGKPEELRGCNNKRCTLSSIESRMFFSSQPRNLYEEVSIDDPDGASKCDAEEFMCPDSKECHDITKAWQVTEWYNATAITSMLRLAQMFWNWRGRCKGTVRKCKKYRGYLSPPRHRMVHMSRLDLDGNWTGGMKCDGEIDCASGFDEDECILGLRYDNVFGIKNWIFHKCAESNSSSDGRLFPKIYRRCPGPYNKQRKLFMWGWVDYNNLQHLDTHKCLAVNITKINETYYLDLILTHCDYNEPKQHWTCIGYDVRLLSPYDIIPDEKRDEIFLKVSDDGPGNYLVLTSERDETTKFYMLGTNKRLSICAKKGYGSLVFTYWSPCDKTCGGGTMRKKRDCAVTGDMKCGGGSLYEVKSCNTDPCPIICPPGFSAHYSVYDDKDINCFKVYDDPKTFTEAQQFCASNNWTLAADKEIHGHNFILDLMTNSRRAYIGVFEDLSRKLHSPYTHLLKYNWDGQPVGGFQPWYDYSTKKKEVGCTVGLGATYYGTISKTDTGKDCESWDSEDVDLQDVVKPLPQLVSPYKSMTISGSNFCRNDDISLDTPWCRIKTKEGLQPQPCRIKDCIDIGNGKTSKGKYMPPVRVEDMFLIHSLEDGFNLCLAVLTTHKVVTAQCDCKDDRQNFYWWAGTSLANVATGMCLAVSSLPPLHGDNVIAETCTRRLSKSFQGWYAEGREISLYWIPDQGPEDTLHPIYKMTHNAKKRKVFISDTRRQLFLAWNSALGMVRMVTLVSKVPGGSYFLLKGHSCGRCIKSTMESKQLQSATCSQTDVHQRWVKLSENVLMNIARSLCLSSYRMRFYVVLTECNPDNIALRWDFKQTGENSIVLRHYASGFFLTCMCTGYTGVCLSPEENNEKVSWDMLVNGQSASAIDIVNLGRERTLGYAFMLHTSYNLTKCARPARPSNDENAKFVAVMTTCQLDDKGLLWWFSETLTQIKHRALGLCLEAQLPFDAKKSNDKMNPSLALSVCSLQSFSSQSWLFISGPTPRDSDELPGDYICLASNSDICIGIDPTGGFGKDDGLLVLNVRTKAKDWTAVTSNGHFVPLAKMADCAQPWQRMEDYKGTKSFTRDGIECQHWDKQYPHRHPFTNETYPNANLVLNYCRRPQSVPSNVLDEKEKNLPWCITTKSDTSWQECSISHCPMTGVVLDKDTGMWETSNGKKPLPFVCHAMPECYIGNGVDYSGYYEHSGRGHCMNWREYNNGDVNWPDHARCMNWNNDTLKPWCWVQRGVAQYCDLVVPCPLRCPDPTPLMRNMYLISISYASPSKLYMPKSSVQVVCEKGYNLTTTDRFDQIWNCTDKGEWEPEPITCRKIFCHPPAALNDALVITSKRVFTYGSTVAYQCKSGFMIEPGRTLIEINCLQNGTWSSPLYKCLPACKEGWTSFNHSCYKLFHHRKYFQSYHSSLEICRNSKQRTLAIPKSLIEYNFISDLAVASQGFSDRYYWVGVRDSTGSDYKDSMVHRNWVGDSITRTSGEAQLYIDKLKNQTFMILSFGATKEEEIYVSHDDRCMYGDPDNKKVISKSCMYNDGLGMHWMWTTHQHLYNIDADLCLSAKEYEESSEGTMPDSVFLSKCDFYNKTQMFTCGPEDGYLLRLRHYPQSYIVLEIKNPHGEIRVGSEKSAGNLASWHTFPGYYYLCHWNIKQPDTIFLVHKDNYPNFHSFFVHDDDQCRVNLTGSVIANTTFATKYMETEPLDWCACAYILDGGKKVNMLPNALSSCTSPGLSAAAKEKGLRKCDDQKFADSLCHRPDGSTPDHWTRPETCAAIAVHDVDDTRLETRQCATRLSGYFCEEPAQWKCPQPIEPTNSVPVFDTNDTSNMQFKYGAKVKIYCTRGHWIEKYLAHSINIVCNKYLHWEIEPKKIREGDLEDFIDNREDREKEVDKIECVKIKCDNPPEILGMNLVDVTDKNLFYNTVATYECLSGTWLDHDRLQYNMTCMSDGEWQPFPSENQMCKTVTCPKPLPIDNSNMTYDGVAFNTILTYTCNRGYWFARYHTVEESRCNEDGRWFPDHVKNNATCVPVSCSTPSTFTLTKANAMNMNARDMYGYQSVLALQCLPGHWFDKDSFALNFTCNHEGMWDPFTPNLVKCERIYCKQPDEVPGATRFGTDYASGSHVRYYCGRMNWIRRQFKIHSPHWDLCLKTSKLSKRQKKTDSVEVLLDKNCGGRDTPNHWWVWHWSFHLKNFATDKCLTAAAIPFLKEDIVSVRVEDCDEENLFQMWTCSSGPANEWLVSMRLAGRGGYLTTVTDEYAFWAGKSIVVPFVTGDHKSVGVDSHWKIYGNKDPFMNICLMREGQFYEESICNSYGEWYPDPRNIKCSLVICGEPEDIPHASIVEDEMSRAKRSDESNEGFRWEIFTQATPDFEVTAKILYKCDHGFWFAPEQFSLFITCLDNSMWDPDPKYLACIPITCPTPNVTALSKAYIQKYEDKSEKTPEEVEAMLDSLSSLPPFRGDIVIENQMNVSYAPQYTDNVLLTCYSGYWISRTSFREEHINEFIPRGMNGSNIIKATCMWQGVWSLPYIHNASIMSCIPLHCPDPGHILNSVRVSDSNLLATPILDNINATNATVTNNTQLSMNDTSDVDRTDNDTSDGAEVYAYNKIVQYQCDRGFWFTVSRSYLEILCNESGHWQPDPAFLECVPVSCGDPGTVVEGVKMGEEYTVYHELFIALKMTHRMNSRNVGNNSFNSPDELIDVVYRCNEGFKIGNKLKEQKIKCLPNGRWFPPPFSIRCERAECGKPPMISHSFVHNQTQLYKDKFTSGDDIIIRCKIGYQLDATTTDIHFKCGLQGEWIPSDQHQQFHCVLTNCDPPPIAQNLTMIDSRLEYHLNDSVYYSCPEGMTLKDNNGFMVEVSCRINSTGDILRHQSGIDRANLKSVYAMSWYPDPFELACELVECPPLDIIRNATLTINGSFYKDIATYTCHPGYKFLNLNNSVINIRCGKFGKWFPNSRNLSCNPIECEKPFINEKIQVSPTQHLNVEYYYTDRITLSCPEKYWLIGITMSGVRGEKYISTVCEEDGNWKIDTSYLVCEIISCLHPGIIPDATLISNIEPVPEEFPVLSKLQVTCREGYVLLVSSTRSHEFECSERGWWSPVNLYDNPRTCEPVVCIDPGQRNNSVQTSTGFGVNHQIIYRAIPGHHSALSRKPIVILTCSINGEWIEDDIEFSNAERVEEEETTILSRRKRKTTSLSTNNTRLEELLSFVTATCDFPDHLSPHAFIDDLEENLEIVCGNNITVNCDEGFVIAVGISKIDIICTDSGEWQPDPQQIKCIDENLIYCNLPDPVEKAIIIGDSYSIRSQIYVRCQLGYEISNSSSEIMIECMLDGIWKPESKNITCRPIECVPPKQIANATLSYDSLSYRSEAYYECNEGMNFNGVDVMKKLVITCVNSDSWLPDPSQYQCEIVQCKKPVPIPYGKVFYTTMTYKSTAVYNCSKGYLTTDYVEDNNINAGYHTVLCNYQGLWSSSSDPNHPQVKKHIKCEPVSCNKSLPIHNNTHVILHAGHFYKSIAEYRCAMGYKTTSGRSSFRYICSEDGKWKIANKSETECFILACPQTPASMKMIILMKKNGIFDQPILSNRNYKTEVLYKCKKNPEEYQILKCMWYQEWEPMLTLTCNDIKCPNPPEMEHASGSGDLDIGSYWNYKCDSGFEVQYGRNDVKMQCVENDDGVGVWIPPYYSILKCHKESCDVPFFIPQYTQVFDQNGKEVLQSEPFTGVEYDLQVNSEITYRCIKGYWEVPSRALGHTTTCTKERKWIPPPPEVITCTMITCDQPPEIKGMRMHGKMASDKYWFTASISYECPPNTFVAELKQYMVESRCGINGTFIPDPLSFQCNETVCEKYMMPHADLMSVTGLKFQNTAQYRCHQSYWFKPGSKTHQYSCGPNGKWEPDVEKYKCKKIKCGNPNIPNLDFDSKQVVKYNETIEVHCIDGYHLTDTNKAFMKTITCSDDGQYVPPIYHLSCTPIACDPPKHSPDANVFGDYFYGGKAYLQCKYGFWIGSHQHSTVAVCGRDGIWSIDFTKTDYVCKPIICSPPPIAINAIQVGNGTVFETRIKYVCKEGYWMSTPFAGTAYEIEIACSNSASWLPLTEISCTRIVCPKPPTISSSSVIHEKEYCFGDAFTYVCEPMKWIVEQKESGWSITGKKEMKIVCGKGYWDPQPTFKCVSLYDMQSVPKGRSNTQSEVFKYLSLSRELPANWLMFDSEIMAVSDGIHAAPSHENFNNRNVSTRSHRDIRFIWDNNPLTFWVGSKTEAIDDEWSIDVYLGRPRALLGIMIMCADDTVSDIGNFTIIFASTNGKVKQIGPFKVYGEKGISGKVDVSFPMNYSSIASAFVYNRLAEEVLWLHILLQPWHDGMVPAVREIGFYVSDVKWEQMFPVELGSSIYFMLTFILSTLLIGPLLYLLEGQLHGKDALLFMFSKLPKQKDETLYKLKFETLKSANKKCHLFLQVIGEKADGPILWLRRDFCINILSKKSRTIVCFSAKNKDLGEIEQIRLMAWIGGNKNLISEKKISLGENILDLKKLSIKQLNNYKSTNLVTTFPNEQQNHIYVKNLIPTSFMTKQVKKSATFIRLRRRHMRMLRCNLLFSIFYPPSRSHFMRLERFLCFVLILVGGCLLTSYLQLLFHIQENNNVIDLYEIRGADVLTAFIGTIVFLPLPLLLRGLHVLCRLCYRRLREDGNTRKYVIHDIMDKYQPNHVLAPKLEIPLGSFFEIDRTHISTSMSALSKFDFVLHDYVKEKEDHVLTSRWSDTALGDHFYDPQKHSENDLVLNKYQSNLSKISGFSVSCSQLISPDKVVEDTSAATSLSRNSTVDEGEEKTISNKKGDSLTSSSMLLSSENEDTLSTVTVRKLSEETITSLRQDDSKMSMQQMTNSQTSSNERSIESSGDCIYSKIKVNTNSIYSALEQGDSKAHHSAKMPSHNDIRQFSSCSDSATTYSGDISFGYDDDSNISHSESTSSVPWPSAKVVQSTKSNKQEEEKNICCYSEHGKLLKHRYIITHLPQEKTSPVSHLRVFTTPVLMLGIFVCSVGLLFMGQKMSELGVGNFTYLSMFSILCNLFVVLPIDTCIAMQVFREHVGGIIVT